MFKIEFFIFRKKSFLVPYLIHFRKTITINIVDGEEYEKNKNFFVELGEPRVSNQDEEFYDIVSF